MGETFWRRRARDRKNRKPVMTHKIALAMACAAGAMFIAAPASAEQAAPPRIQIAVSAGSLGIGPELTYRPTPMLGVRASAGFLNASHKVNSGGVDYNGALTLQNYGAMIDLYPFQGHFRISAGLRVNQNRLKLTATPSGPTTIGGNTYTPAQIGTMSGLVKTSQIAPMATVGWAGGLTRGIKMSLDLGAMLSGSPRVSNLTTTSNLISPADLAAEQTKINNTVHKYSIYPVVQASIGYAF
jgi:hypothetical protein